MTDDFNRALARVVSQRIAARYVSERAFAALNGVPPSVVSRLVNGLHSPSIATLRKIAAGLQTTASGLLAEAEEATCASS